MREYFVAIRPMGPFDLPEEADGAALETLFLQSVRAINDYFELEYSINFWRTVAGDEVDFVLYGAKGIHAFEIKTFWLLLLLKHLKVCKNLRKSIQKQSCISYIWEIINDITVPLP